MCIRDRCVCGIFAEDVNYANCYRHREKGIYLWIAGHRYTPETAFQWHYNFMTTYGVRHNYTYDMNYTNWQNGEPNNWRGLGENCINLWPKFGYRWNDHSCSLEACFVCENRHAA